MRELPQAAYDRHRHVADGVVATCIPQLADAEAACLASVASVRGSGVEVHDRHPVNPVTRSLSRAPGLAVHVSAADPHVAPPGA